MKKGLLLLVPLAVAIAGCKSNAVVDVPQQGRIPRKEFKDMTKEEKIQFIQMTPVPQEAKQKQIDLINQGKL